MKCPQSRDSGGVRRRGSEVAQFGAVIEKNRSSYGPTVPLVFLRAGGSRGGRAVRKALLQERIKGGFTSTLPGNLAKRHAESGPPFLPRPTGDVHTNIFRVPALGSPSSWWVWVWVPSVGRGRGGGWRPPPTLQEHGHESCHGDAELMSGTGGRIAACCPWICKVGTGCPAAGRLHSGGGAPASRLSVGGSPYHGLGQR